MSNNSTLEKITYNAQQGLKLRATSRLASMINDNPNDLTLRNKLAQIYFDAGFLDAAGKYWILNDSNESHIQKCIQLYEKSVNNSGNQILRDIKFKGDKLLLNEYAQSKLKQLEKDSLEKTDFLPSYYPKEKKEIKPLKKSNPTIQKLGCTLVVIILVFCLIALYIGANQIFDWFLK